MTEEESYLINFVWKFDSLWQHKAENFNFFKSGYYRIIQIPNALEDKNEIHYSAPGARFYFFDIREMTKQPEQINLSLPDGQTNKFLFGGSEFEYIFSYSIEKPSQSKE